MLAKALGRSPLSRAWLRACPTPGRWKHCFARRAAACSLLTAKSHWHGGTSSSQAGVFATSHQHRTFITDSLPTILVPPAVFTGLLLALWTYKCMMTILFQDKIIYMPYMPPFARSEKLEDYVAGCRPVEWEEKRIKSLDGTRLSLTVGDIAAEGDEVKRDVVICYFQGNGSSTPPRLPLLSQVLKLVHAQSSQDVRFTLVALSYRGYWNSSGRATQSGIELDAQALLDWVAETYPANTEVILWGQSVGAGVASTAAAKYLSRGFNRVRIAGLILETPFTSIKSMLLALYPQKWLPYQYLHPFLWNHWDSEAALRAIAQDDPISPKILLLPASRDEVVPAEEIAKLEGLCKELKLNYERKDVIGALHTEATMRREGQEAVAKFILRVASHRRHQE